jgi:hypothetical protein
MPDTRKVAKLIEKLVEVGMPREDAEREAPALAELVPDTHIASTEAIAARKRERSEYGPL